MSEREMIEKILSVIRKNEKLAKVLEYAVKVEEEKMEKYGKDYPVAWNNMEVHAPRQWIEHLLVEEIVKLVCKTSKHTEFRLMNREAVKQALKEYQELTQTTIEEETKIPDDLFDDIVGYDDLKELFMKALKTGGVHFLLVGPPASGKTMFLFCLEKLPRTKYLVGSRLTKSGLTDYLFSHQPKILLLDEIDKMDAVNYAVLLSLCESGRVTEMLFNRSREILLDTVVFACCNQIKIPEEILSRFEIIEFKRYSKDEFIHVVKNLLVRRGKEDELAEYIAKTVAEDLQTTDPREAVRIAKLCNTKEDVDKTIRIIKKYRR